MRGEKGRKTASDFNKGGAEVMGSVSEHTFTSTGKAGVTAVHGERARMKLHRVSG